MEAISFWFILLIAPKGIEIDISWKHTDYRTAFNRTKRDWNMGWNSTKQAGVSLLIAPKGIEITQNFWSERGRRALLIAPKGIEIKINFLSFSVNYTFNRTKRDWNFRLYQSLLHNNKLLIAPKGIEIFTTETKYIPKMTFNRTKRDWNKMKEKIYG